MICNQCGIEMGDAPYCPNCGSAAPAQPQGGNNKVAIIAVAAVAVVAIIAIVALVIPNLGGGKSNAKKLLETYTDAIVEEDAELYLSVYPECYIDYLEDEMVDWYGYDDAEEYAEEYIGDYLDDLEDGYGRDLKFSFKIIECEKVDEDDLEDYEEEMEELFGDSDKIEGAYEVEFEYTIEGDDDDDEDDGEMVIVKIDGEWYIHTLDLEFL